MPIAPRPVPPPAPKPEPRGLFGGKSWREFSQVKEAARSDEYFRPAPGYGRQWGRDERAALIEEAGKLGGHAYGVKREEIPSLIEKMRVAQWPDEKIKMFKSLVEDK